MKNLHELFLNFIENSPNRLEHLIKLDENLKFVRIESVREKVIDVGITNELLYEYVIELSRNNLRGYISLVEIKDETKPEGKIVEVLMDNGDSFVLGETNIRFQAFGMCERLFLDIDFVVHFLNTLLYEFRIYDHIKNYQRI